MLAGLVWIAILDHDSQAATKIHVIAFGKAMPVQWDPGTGSENRKPLPMKLRPMMVDGRIKEYVVGAAHEVTDRLFVVRRAFRVNDSLPEDSGPRWQWQRGGWLIADRMTGRISAITLPEFDSLYSVITWYRDYAAYCGVTDDGKKIDAFVVQIGRRRPVLKKLLSNEAIKPDAPPDSACSAPVWERNPTRVSFEAAGAAKDTFSIRGQLVDLVNDEDEDDEAK